MEKLKWKKVNCKILDREGNVRFSLNNVEAPRNWSSTAVEIAALKYFRKVRGRSERSIQQMVNRVVNTIVNKGVKKGVNKNLKKEHWRKFFREELIYILLKQKAFFNSPVWFNCGIYERPQVSACFIQSVEDDLDGIFELLKNEARIFKFGSGSGTNFSRLRSKFEDLAHGGKSSGLMAFLDVFDRGAGSVKSGGTTRRAAKMVLVNDDHPEILDFIDWKVKEERKAQALIREGYSSDFDGEAYRTVSGQNSNNSVRVSDSFMKAVRDNKIWKLKARTGRKKVLRELPAQEIWNRIVAAAWESADPGLQFDSTINEWHTCLEAGRILASNPCSEYMFFDNSACNLASLNLISFLDEAGNFDLKSYLKTIEIIFTAQDILIDLAGYPTKAIDQNSRGYRPLGIGFCGLGGFLMRKGIPYDSEEGRSWAAVLTALLQGQAVLTSISRARSFGVFPQYKKVKKGFLKVLRKQAASLRKIDFSYVDKEFQKIIFENWKKILEDGNCYGFRNAQFTNMAPTGTIGLVMDCDTTGIEPEYALVHHKRLSGGGTLQMTSRSALIGLKNLDYTSEQIERMKNYMLKNFCLEGAADLKPEHLPIFDCAQRNGLFGKRQISALAHLNMMAAIQPFLSGAISKTVNLPNESTKEEISDIYWKAWELGLKSISIYRDGCKMGQPLRAKNSDSSESLECVGCGEEKLS